MAAAVDAIPPAMSADTLTGADRSAESATKTAPLRQQQRRARNTDQWQRSQRRQLHVAGRQYLGTHGRLVAPRSIGPDCQCRAQCYVKVSEASRQKIFNGFYALASHDEQNSYLYGLIVKKDVDVKRKLCSPSTSAPLSRGGGGGTSERRSAHYAYYVRDHGHLIQICKTAFAHIHGITFKKIRILCEKLDMNVLFPRDGRGKHSNRPTKVADTAKQQVREHINSVLCGDRIDASFVRFTTNSCCSSTKSVVDNYGAVDSDIGPAVAPVSAPTVNVAKMYQHYIKWWRQKQNSIVTGSQQQQQQQQQPQERAGEDVCGAPAACEPVKQWLYSRVFNDEFRGTALRLLAATNTTTAATAAADAADTGTTGARQWRRRAPVAGSSSSSAIGSTAAVTPQAVDTNRTPVCETDARNEQEISQSDADSVYKVPCVASTSSLPLVSQTLALTTGVCGDQTLLQQPPPQLPPPLPRIHADCSRRAVMALPERQSTESPAASVVPVVSGTLAPPAGDFMSLSCAQLPHLVLDQSPLPTAAAAAGGVSVGGGSLSERQQQQQQLQLLCVPMIDCYLELQAQPLDLHHQNHQTSNLQQQQQQQQQQQHYHHLDHHHNQQQQQQHVVHDNGHSATLHSDSQSNTCFSTLHYPP